MVVYDWHYVTAHNNKKKNENENKNCDWMPDGK